MAFAIILNQKPSPWFLALQFVLQGLSALSSSCHCPSSQQ